MKREAKIEGQRRAALPSVEKVRQELGRAESIDDFFGKEGIFAKLFTETLEQMLEAELTDPLGDEKYEAKGRNSGNSRNGKTNRKLRTSNGTWRSRCRETGRASFNPRCWRNTRRVPMS